MAKDKAEKREKKRKEVEGPEDVEMLGVETTQVRFNTIVSPGHLTLYFSYSHPKRQKKIKRRL
jgi:H/ACA ribonucleoprotein complex subunit 2